MILKNLEKEIWCKESHEGKKLGKHIEECKSLTTDFLNFYSLGEYKEFAELLCYYHDLGKLKDTWSVENEKNSSHSSFSFFILFNKYKSNLENYPILGLFVLKHHGNLRRIEDRDIFRVKEEASQFEKEKIDDEIKNWWKVLYRYVNKLTINSKVNLVDTYGLFKFADILSANNLTNYKITTPNKSIEDLKLLVLAKIQRKKLEIRKEALRRQLSLGRINTHLLIKAPTGWGKTAASLFYAVGKGSKIIYVLPTITSIKSFYDDLCTFFGKENVGEFFYYADVEAVKREESDFKEVIFSSYFAQPVIITTLDQLLLTFLQVGKYFMKRPHLRNSVIILDEIHTFSQNMLYILSYFLDKFSRLYNLKLCVMSATFPSVLERYFENLLTEIEKLWLNKELENKRRVMYRIKEKDTLDIAENIVEIYKSSKKPFRMAVICNTVEKAQNLFEKLTNIISGINIELLHSRFIYKHRSEKEDRINNWIRNRESFILIATQVIEVSLDISFDFMITECAPLESLIQRFGRVNRYENKTDEINVWIAFPSEIDDKKRYPYSKEDIINTWSFLKDFEGDNLKNELQLIKEYDNVANLSQTKQREIYNLLESWNENTNFFYSWQVKDEFAQKLFKFREDFTSLAIPNNYRDVIEKLYEKIRKKNISYFEKRKIFAEIKEYTLPVPLWLLKTWEEESFPIIDLPYDETYGLRKDYRCTII